MTGINKFKVRILALVWALVGFTGTLLFISYINSVEKDTKKKETKKVVEIQTAPKKKPPKKVKKKITKKVKKQTKPLKPIAPPPGLSEGISGVEVNIPEFSVDTGSLASDSEDLVGNVKENNLIMTAESVDQPPIPSTRVAPEYPKTARARGITGYVTFSLLIDEFGNIQQVEIIESNPPGVFDKQALNAIKQWKFEPGKYKGRPVKVWVKQTIKFQLQ